MYTVQIANGIFLVLILFQNLTMCLLSSPFSYNLAVCMIIYKCIHLYMKTFTLISAYYHSPLALLTCGTYALMMLYATFLPIDSLRHILAPSFLLFISVKSYYVRFTKLCNITSICSIYRRHTTIGRDSRQKLGSAVVKSSLPELSRLAN